MRSRMHKCRKTTQTDKILEHGPEVCPYGWISGYFYKNGSLSVRSTGIKGSVKQSPYGQQTSTDRFRKPQDPFESESKIRSCR